MKRVFVDVETTGLHADNKDRIIEVAAVKYDVKHNSVRKVGEYHRFVNPGRKVPTAATRIHGITTEQLADMPPFKEIAASLADFLRGCELVAHNAKFDMAFLNMEFKRIKMPSATRVVGKDNIVDSLKLARELFPRQKNTLDALATRYGIDIKKRRPVHGALVDSEILAEVYHLMLQDALEIIEEMDEELHREENKKNRSKVVLIVLLFAVFVFTVLLD